MYDRPIRAGAATGRSEAVAVGLGVGLLVGAAVQPASNAAASRAIRVRIMRPSF